MSDLSSEEDQNTEPDKRNGRDHRDYTKLRGSNEVGKDGSGDKKQRYGEQAVRASHEDVLEASLTFKQGGQTPVCKNEEEQRNKNADARPCVFSARAGDVPTRIFTQASPDRTL